MNLKASISRSSHALLIHLNEGKIEDIVEKKLFYFLAQRPLGQRILKTFYEPIEQAVIEIILQKNKGNQSKTSEALGINRNTLKKKVTYYFLDVKKLLIKNPHITQLYPNQLFLSSISSLNLLTVSRAKLYLEQSHNRLPKSDILLQVCKPVEKKIIQTTLNYFKNNKKRASYFLGINRNTLKKKLSFKPKVIS